MIKVRCFERSGAQFWREIEPVLCRNGLALQKCDVNLYALIHVPSGWSLNMRSMRPRQAEDWFHAASAMMDWTCSVEAIKTDPRVIAALKVGKELEEKFYFPDEKVEEKAEQATLFDMEEAS
jgi:hypothetical protein